MDKSAAQKLVQETLQGSFNKERFVYLVKNILKRFDESKAFHARGYVKEKFRTTTPIVKTYERLGTYTDHDDKKIDLLIVYLQSDRSIERARTSLRNFVADYLKQRNMKDAALVAFVAPNGEDWRFSLVKMEYRFNEKGKVEEEFTPARRYSFLVGKNENSHTAQSRLLPVLLNDKANPTLEELEEVFSVERVTKEFFEKYRDIFLRLKESLDDIVKKDAKVKAGFEAKNIDTVDFAKKLLGQVVFLYFLQKKGWFGVKRGEEWSSGSKHFLRELFEKKHSDYKNFFNDILEPLFYEALRLERSGDYYSRFNCRIPFLNGGLFDPINDYDWWKTDILLPDDIFSNDRRTKEGDIGDGILDIFDRYNFTVKEDEPLEKEVAIDPEMLGKVFENLLEVKDRKSKGTYYTPREIVHYMCQESLANYLATELEGKTSKEEIETLIKYGEAVVEHDSRVVNEGRETERYAFKLPQSVRTHAKLIDEKLASIRVCDPAVGSGAFPVGMMNEIVRTRNALTPYIGENGERSPYHFKRQAIQNCLYGVDIDPGAVEIAKLRLWLSLVVDEEEREKIQPLPNLDYKIVQGNSLLSVEKNLFNLHLFNQLEELKPLYFNETSASKKQEYRKQIDELISRITNGHKEFDFEVYFSEVFRRPSPSPIMGEGRGEGGGFDVVIANPPYVRQEEIKEQKPALEKQGYEVYNSTSDLYTYFYERSYKILRPNGYLCFISSNKWMRAKYGEKLRRFFKAKTILKQIIDFNGYKVFGATVDTNIILFQKAEPINNVVDILNIQPDFTTTTDISNYFNNHKLEMKQSVLATSCFTFGNEAVMNLKAKIEKVGMPLKNWDVKIYRGVLTGFNEAFIIDTETKEKLCKEDPKSSEIIKPILRGRDIGRYYYKWAGMWLIFVPWHFPLHKDENIQGASKKAEETFIKQYPVIYKHLEQFKESLSSRNKDETGIRYEWYALQRCAATYYPEFEKEKIVYQEMTNKGSFAWDTNRIYVNQTCYIMTNTNKYILALLNSRIIHFYFSQISYALGIGAFRWIKQFVEQIPIPNISEIQRKPFIDIVDKILAITKDPEGKPLASNGAGGDYLENPAKQTQVRDYEKQIDQLVYELYGLTDEEIKIVEGSRS